MISQILSDFEKFTAKDFIKLIEEVLRTLELERTLRRLGKFDVSEDLIYCTEANIDRCIIIGDIHGDLDSLLEIFKIINIEKTLNEEKSALVFLGDYGDRGDKSVEIYYLLLNLKLLYKNKIILLRGNHEGPDDLLAHPHDLPLQFIEKYGQEGYFVYLKLRGLFEKLYLAFLVMGKFIALHGGIPSKASTPDDIAIARKIHPKKRLLEELLWNDPMEDLGLKDSYRGAGMLFGKDLTENFLAKNNLKLVIRGHEPVREGYSITHDGKLITVFSRKGPPYYNAKAAFLDIKVSELNSHEDINKFIVTF